MENENLVEMVIAKRCNRIGPGRNSIWLFFPFTWKNVL